MNKSHDRLQIISLSTFLCICLLAIVLLLERDRTPHREVVQPTMTDASNQRMRSILNSLDGQTIIDPKSSDLPNSFLQDEPVLLVIYPDQDCSTCLREMKNLLGRLQIEFKLSIFAINQSGGKNFPKPNLVHIDHQNIIHNSQIFNVPTPILVYLDHLKRVKASFISTLSDDQNWEKYFLDIIRELNSS